MKTTFKDNPVNAKDALEKSGLNFKVTKMELKTIIGGQQIPDKFATWRTDKIQSSDGYLGCVGNNYKIIQNEESLNFFDSVMSREELCYTEAGYVNNGNKVWLKCKLPDTMKINANGGTDEIEKHILLANSHDGTSSLSIRFTTLRLICTNGMTAEVKDKKASVSIRHCSNSDDKLKDAYRIMNLAKSSFKVWEEKINKIANIKIGSYDLGRYYDVVLDIKDRKEASTKVLNTKKVLEHLFRSGVGHELSGGTVWGAINSVTEYIDHYKNFKNQEKDYGILFGTGDTLKLKAQYVAEEMFL